MTCFLVLQIRSFKFRQQTLPDQTCGSTGCSLILPQEVPALGAYNRQILRLIDGATGEERWRLQIPGFPEGPQLLTDLDADGVMDVMYADTPLQPNTRINAIDSVPQSLRWRRPLVPRSSAPASRPHSSLSTANCVRRYVATGTCTLHF